ncbi:MAG: hypothetical protein ACE5QW_01125 [Thermoplasmata archaeon]
MGKKKPKETSKETSKEAPRKSQVETAAAKISKAETLLKELRGLDAETKEMVGKLSDAKFHFKNKDYRKSSLLCSKALRVGKLSKRTKKAYDTISEVMVSAEELGREDYDLSETFEILKAAEVALADSNFGALRILLSEAKKSMKQAKQLKKIQKELAGTKLSVMDLKRSGSVTLESEILLSEASEALREKDLKKARDLLKAVRKWIDIEILEKERHELLLAQDHEEISERVTDLSPQIQEFHKLGIDTSWMEECIAEASEALDEGNFVGAKRHLLELEETVRSLKGSTIRAAREAIDKAMEEIEEARRKNIGVLVAERSLNQAEKAFLKEEFKDSIDFAQLSISFVKRSIRRIASKEGDLRRDEDFTQALIEIGKIVSEKSEAIKEGRELPPEGRKILDDSIIELESTYLTSMAQEDLESMRSTIEEADSRRVGVNEAKIMLRKAQDAFRAENYAAVTVLERTVRNLLSGDKEKKSRATA